MSGRPGRPTRAPRRSKHTHTRVWFTAMVRREGAETVLAVAPGARRVVVKRETGEAVIDYQVAGVKLDAAPGDELLVFGPAIDETAIATVTESTGAGLRVCINGELAADTTTVHLLKLALAAPARRPR